MPPSTHLIKWPVRQDRRWSLPHQHAQHHHHTHPPRLAPSTPPTGRSPPCTTPASSRPSNRRTSREISNIFVRRGHVLSCLACSTRRTRRPAVPGRRGDGLPRKPDIHHSPMWPGATENGRAGMHRPRNQLHSAPRACTSHAACKTDHILVIVTGLSRSSVI